MSKHEETIQTITDKVTNGIKTFQKLKNGTEPTIDEVRNTRLKVESNVRVGANVITNITKTIQDKYDELIKKKQ